MHQAPGQMHVVIAKEDHMRACIRLPDELDPLLNQCLPSLVRWMRFPGDDQLYRAFGIAQYAKQPLPIVQQQVWSLVGGEAPGKAQC